MHLNRDYGQKIHAALAVSIILLLIIGVCSLFWRGGISFVRDYSALKTQREHIAKLETHYIQKMTTLTETSTDVPYTLLPASTTSESIAALFEQKFETFLASAPMFVTAASSRHLPQRQQISPDIMHYTQDLIVSASPTDLMTFLEAQSEPVHEMTLTYKLSDGMPLATAKLTFSLYSEMEINGETQ